MSKILLPPIFKRLFLSVGFYQQARRFYRLLFNRESLQSHTESIAFYNKLIKTKSLCFDIGANIGEKTEVLLQLGLNVVAFEPQQNCVEEINLRCQPYKNRLQICQCAIGSNPGNADLYISTINNKSSLNSSWNEVSESIIIVPVMTLDQAIAKFGQPDYCKIDVEGWELEVLKGLTQPIPLISFEYHIEQKEVNKTIDCIMYLANLLGEIQLNITPAEKLVFHFSEWLSLDDFLECFPQDFVNKAEYQYGDIFIIKA